MNKNLKVGILKETKTPPDKRTAVAPLQAVELLKRFPNVELFIQSSDIRSYKDEEYLKLGLNIVEDVSNCDILIGVKEVKLPKLIENKTYLFFSHTAKKQEYNRILLQELLKKKIKMVDYEYLANPPGQRLVAFGHFAGLVGAYNGLIAFGKRTGLFDLKRAIDSHDTAEMFEELKKVKLPAVKILITGGGRVASGALETLAPLNLKKVSPEDFLSKSFNDAVYTQIEPDNYVKRIDGSDFDLNHFFKNPKEYESDFLKYTKVTDIYIACHFWDNNSPHFITKQDISAPDFKIKVIADVSCDIAGPIISTFRASEIANPFYGYNPKTHLEGNAFDNNCITVMAVDNLPGEVPRDASVDFGKGLIDKVFPALFCNDNDGIIKRATITKSGNLGSHFTYLQDFADGK
jgi:alanine dehydrogenase